MDMLPYMFRGTADVGKDFEMVILIWIIKVASI